MVSEYHSIALSLVDDKNDEFIISTGFYSPELKQSIEFVGLLNAPTLLARSGRYNIVAGFKRVAVCRALGWDTIMARCLPPETTPMACALIAVADNASQRNLNVVELSRAVGLLSRSVAEAGASESFSHFKRLGIGMNLSLLQKLQRVVGMDEEIKDALANGVIALPVAEKLDELQDVVEQKLLCRLLTELNLSLNRQRDLVEWIVGITKRENCSIAALLSEKQVRIMIEDRNSDRGLKSQTIRSYFKKRRYPEISEHEERYERTVKNLSLKNGVRIIPPAHFEGRKYSIQLDFENQMELIDLNKELQRIASSRELLELLGGF